MKIGRQTPFFFYYNRKEGKNQGIPFKTVEKPFDNLILGQK